MIPILQFNELSPEDILNRDIRQETGVDEAVDAVLAAVRERGDDALRDYTRRFDGAELQELQVSQAELDAAWDSLDAEFIRTLNMAAENIRHFHEQQVHRDFSLTGGHLCPQRAEGLPLHHSDERDPRQNRRGAGDRGGDAAG